jgi:hypothetical protein
VGPRHVDDEAVVEVVPTDQDRAGQVAAVIDRDSGRDRSPVDLEGYRHDRAPLDTERGLHGDLVRAVQVQPELLGKLDIDGRPRRAGVDAREVLLARPGARRHNPNELLAAQRGRGLRPCAGRRGAAGPDEQHAAHGEEAEEPGHHPAAQDGCRTSFQPYGLHVQAP